MNPPAILLVKLDQLAPWPENPRGILVEDYARLKTQVEQLGQFKPLICYELAPSSYVVLGGNMRLMVYQELKLDPILISVVDAPDLATRMKYALADNDRAGYYDILQLQELGSQVIDQLDPELFKVDLGKPITLGDVVRKAGPEDDPQETKERRLTRCPKCGHEW